MEVKGTYLLFISAQNENISSPTPIIRLLPLGTSE